MRNLKRFVLISFLVSLSIFGVKPIQIFGEELLIIYPSPESEIDERTNYPVQLLRLGLQKSGEQFQLQATERSMQQGRALKFLTSNKEINVLWTMTSKDNAKLANIIEAGLNEAIKDDLFDTLFKKFHQDSIQRANLKERRIFELENPSLPSKTPVNRKEIWFTID